MSRKAMKKLNEDGEPVTTTDNGGNGLIHPQLPIVPNNMFRRYKEMKKKQKSVNVEKTNTLM